MNVAFRESFLRDLRRVRNNDLKRRVKQAIDRVEAAESIQDVPNVRKLQGGERHYRVRVGTYRIGLVMESDRAVFVRFLHRRELYRYFP